jgi:tetratricopeptide (TPR) repeat protein
MKKINDRIALIFTISALLSASCTEDFLDQKPTSSITELTYYRSVDELETGLVACFATISWNNSEIQHWAFGDIGSDDADCGSIYTDQPDLYNVSYSRQNASNTIVYGNWWTYYSIIARCNQVIDKSAGTKGDAAEIEKIVDQARFLRALSFYHLVTGFGDVPLVNRFLNPDELNLERAPAADIWAQIESDLKEATNLPTVSEWNESGRVTSGAVYSLLGKVYLTQKKYAQANSAFNKVLQSNEYKLVPDFGFIFRYEGENCAESIFEIQYKTNISGGANLGTWSAPFRMPRDNEAGGWGFDCPTADLLKEFEPGDPRIIYTFMFPGDVFPMGTGTYTVLNEWSPTGYNSRKAWLPWSERENLGWWEWDINYRYMRYAEVLLLYAESLNEVNKPDSARMLVNMVRNRARDTPSTDPQRISCAYSLSHPTELLPDVTTSNQSDLRQAIWHEQRVELAIEGHRRNILLRTGRFKERMEAAKAYEGVIVEPYELLLPIPQQEIELSNGDLTQNPGY